jgi:hypothetical protein
MLGALRFELPLPALVDRNLLLRAAIAAGDPANYRADCNGSCYERDKGGANLGHVSIRFVYP